MAARGEGTRRTLWVGGAILLGAAAPLAAQTDYYNTDRGRPLQVEDAYPVELHAFELQMAPVRLERVEGERYNWEVEPELAYGILPRTQLEIGFPFLFVDAGAGGGGEARGLAGLNVSALHNLNVESRTLPAFAVAADVALPVGPFAPERPYASARAIATRNFGLVRFHANGQYTLGAAPAEGEASVDASRWMAGLAADRSSPLHGLLMGVGVLAERPLHEDEAMEWTAESGIRYQTSPQFNLDLGVGHRFTGSERGWFFTFGFAHAFAVRSLIPIN